MASPSQTGKSVLFDLSARTKLRLTGADRLRFLNGQITNDVRKATESVAIEACILSAKGKMNGHVFLSTPADSFFLDAAAELQKALPTRLERYVIADDVQIENATGQLSILHILSATKPELRENCRVISVQRFIEPGWDIWIEADRRDSVLEQLSGTHQIFDPAAGEVFRIEQGIPRWGRELTEEIIPIEANLEARTVDYEKGCYIGQEVISRIKMSGQTNKRLCGLVSLSDAPLAAGMKLKEPAGKEVGRITSAAFSENVHRQIALGYVKRGFNHIATELAASGVEGSDGLPVEIVALPFR
jgi:folate-binding protein YgfZ